MINIRDLPQHTAHCIDKRNVDPASEVAAGIRRFPCVAMQ